MLENKDLQRIGQIFDEKLDPVKASLNSLAMELADMKATLAKIDKRTDEDTTAAYGEIEKLKKRISSVEEQMRILQAQKA